MKLLHLNNRRGGLTRTSAKNKGASLRSAINLKLYRCFALFMLKNLFGTGVKKVFFFFNFAKLYTNFSPFARSFILTPNNTFLMLTIYDFLDEVRQLRKRRVFNNCERLYVYIHTHKEPTKLLAGQPTYLFFDSRL